MKYVERGQKLKTMLELAACKRVIYRDKVLSGLGIDEQWNRHLERWMDHGELYAAIERDTKDDEVKK